MSNTFTHSGYTYRFQKKVWLKMVNLSHVVAGFSLSPTLYRDVVRWKTLTHFTFFFFPPGFDWTISLWTFRSDQMFSHMISELLKVYQPDINPGRPVEAGEPQVKPAQTERANSTQKNPPQLGTEPRTFLFEGTVLTATPRSGSQE